jgi:hypothetical protein
MSDTKNKSTWSDGLKLFGIIFGLYSVYQIFDLISVMNMHSAEATAMLPFGIAWVLASIFATIFFWRKSQKKKS